MPRPKSPPRIWTREPRYDAAGRVTHNRCIYIVDGTRRTSLGDVDDAEAERTLADYLGDKHYGAAQALRPVKSILVSDVIAKYAKDVAPHHADPGKTRFRLQRLLAFFAGRTLADINGSLCREYAERSSTDAMARRDLQDLAAAIAHHRKEGLHREIVAVVMPPSRPPRERWLTRDEIARLLWTAWRRPRCKNVAYFILLALYTGRRAGVVYAAAFEREPGRPFVDLENGMLLPPERAKLTKKRNPAIPLPSGLLSHLARIRKGGRRYVLEWGGHPVGRSVGQTMTDIAAEIGLGKVTPHVLRHTAATWIMRAGADMYKAGRYLGMTPRTLDSVYGHHDDAMLAEVREAFRRRK